MRSVLIVALFFISLNGFCQWKSFYPEAIKKTETNKSYKDNLMFDSFFFDALKAKSLENYTESLKLFQKCMSLNSSIALPYYESALINLKIGSIDIAEEQIAIAAKINPKNRWYLFTYAKVLFTNQSFEKSAEQYKKLLLIENRNEDLYHLLAKSFIYDNKLDEAISVYDELEEYKGIEKMISMQKHKLYMQLNENKKAISELLKLVDKFPSDTEVLEILSEAYLLNDEKNKAFDIFKKLSFIDPENGRIHLTLADYYRQNQENDKSFEELKLAFKSYKLNIDVKVKVLLSYFQIISENDTMLYQANELSELLIQTHKGDPKAHALYADFLYMQNRFEESKKHYLIVLENNKKLAPIWTQVLFIQAEQRDFVNLLKTSNEALLYFPTDPLFFYFNGLSNKWFKNNDDAILSFEMGVEFVINNNPLLLEFYSSLADLHHLKANYSISDSLYEKVLEIDPENLIVLNNYAYYLSIRKTKLSLAKKMSLKSNQIEPNNGTYQDTYAWIMYNLGDYENARIWIKKALENGSDSSAVVVEHYGDILFKLGDKEGALFQWKKAMRLEGGGEFLLKKINEKRLYE